MNANARRMELQSQIMQLSAARDAAATEQQKQALLEQPVKETRDRRSGTRVTCPDDLREDSQPVQTE